MREFLIILLFAFHGQAADAYECAPPMDEDQVINLVKNLKKDYFQELGHFNLQIKFRNKQSDTFLKTGIKWNFFAVAKKQRKYSIIIQKLLLKCPPPLSGLKAILIHELFHIKDYIGRSSAQLLALFISLIPKQTRAKYERGTDLRTMKLGHSAGLSAFRTWIYQFLDPKELKKKKFIYYTPEEIEEWQQEHEFQGFFLP